MSLYKSKEHTEKKSFISLKPEEETVSLNKIPAKLSLSSLSGFCHLSRTKQKVKKKILFTATGWIMNQRN